jgi:hypothetical protein
MTTSAQTRNRKPRPKPEPHVTLGIHTNGVYALHITIGTGDKAKHFGYYVRRIPAEFGLAFRFEKFETERVEGEPSDCDVLIDLDRGYHSCTCKGGTYHGHCKHAESILALIQSGKIDVPAPAQQTALEPIAFDDP